MNNQLRNIYGENTRKRIYQTDLDGFIKKEHLAIPDFEIVRQITAQKDFLKLERHLEALCKHGKWTTPYC